MPAMGCKVVSLRGGGFQKRRKETPSLIVLYRHHCPSPSLFTRAIVIRVPPKLLLLAFTIAVRVAFATALRVLSLAFAITARVTVAGLRYRWPSYCRCLQCRCTSDKSLPISGPSSSLCRTGLCRAKQNSPTATKKSEVTRNTVVCVHSDCPFFVNTVYSASE